MVFLIYFFSSIIATFPLVNFLGKYLIGRGGLDGFAYMWNHFSFWYQIINLQQPFFSKLIFYPIGANLFFHDYSPFISLIGLPFLQHPVLYLNLIVIFGLTFSACTAFYLAKYITKSTPASLLSGFIYGFSPTAGSFILSQHYYYLIASIFLPLGVLFLLKFINGFKKSLVIFFMVCWILFFVNYYFFFLLILLSTILLISLILSDYEVRKKLFNKSIRSHYLKSFLSFFLIPGLVVLGIIITSKDYQSFNGSSSNYGQICKADLVGLISPPSEKTYSFFNFKTNGDTPFYYLGIIFVATVFLCFSFYRKEKYVISLVITLFVILLFTLGLSINFQTPFYWLSKLPFIGLIDCPVRFVAGVHLLIALLAAIFISLIFKRNRFIAIMCVFLFAVSMFSDYRFSSFPFINVHIPQIYSYIAGQQDNKTVLELPSGLTESKGSFGYDGVIEGLHAQEMFWQTIYKKPRVGGYISRIPKSTYDYFRNKLIISDLFTLTSRDGSWSDKNFTTQEKNQFINDLNLGFIVVAPVPRQQEFIQATEQILSGLTYRKLVFEDYVLYQIE
ncbi:MAG: hypothetical protein US80_C0005G0007 [Candidatus Daviesbacteria bacterium GW2011_GWA2_38_17]|nr:MAG: hypothetical protein US80_C0005G0007 [Candidatus Daviesbacteria bacterium GW2011_GWA2_38_17]